MIYYGLLIYLIIVEVFIKYRTHIKNRKKFITALWFIPMWLIMGLRWGVGADFFSYKLIFEHSDNMVFQNFSYIEKGFLTLNWLIHKVSSDSVYYFLICAFIILFTFINEISYASSNCLLSVILFLTLGYYFNSMNAMRQFIAVGISFYSVRYLDKKDWYKFMIYILIASLFHKSVLILIPVYLAVIYIKDSLFYFGSFVLFAIINLFSGVIFNVLASYSSFFGKYMIHSTTEQRVSVLNIIICLAVFISCIYFNQKQNREKLSIYSKYTWLALLCFVFLNQYGTAATRIAFYFTPIYILAIPDILQLMNNRKSKVLAYSIIIVICFAYLGILLRTSIVTGNNFVPYKSVFNK